VLLNAVSKRFKAFFFYDENLNTTFYQNLATVFFFLIRLAHLTASSRHETASVSAAYSPPYSMCRIQFNRSTSSRHLYRFIRLWRPCQPTDIQTQKQFTPASSTACRAGDAGYNANNVASFIILASRAKFRESSNVRVMRRSCNFVNVYTICCLYRIDRDPSAEC